VKTPKKIQKRVRRKKRIRGRVAGTSGRPRLTVYRSLKHIYAQVIDDLTAKTIVQASTLSPEIKPTLAGLKKAEKAKKVGALVAQKCLEKKLDKVVFDRNGYLYHGRVQALADGARAAGLKF
jgi:large subunit ribosomal protein L18